MYEGVVFINVCILVLINVWRNCINKMYEEFVLNKCFIKGA